MVQNAAEGKKDVRSVNTGQNCCNTELKIVGNSNITGLLNFWNYNTRLHAAQKHYKDFHCLLTDETPALIQVHLEFPETSQRN